MTVPAAAAAAGASSARRPRASSPDSWGSGRRRTPTAQPADTQPAETDREPEQAPDGTESAPETRYRSYRPRSSGGAVRTGSGVILGVVVYCMAQNFLEGGMPQVRGWLGAKLVNKPYGEQGGMLGGMVKKK